jgi:hypothetical protein
MKTRLFLSLALALFLPVAACGSIVPVPYTPQPSRIKDPMAETTTIIESNTTQGCIAQPELTRAMLVVKFACSRAGVGNAVVRFDRVSSIEIQRYNEWYRVLVHQTGGAEDFAWTSKSLNDMQRLADALTALSKPTKPTERSVVPVGTTL